MVAAVGRRIREIESGLQEFSLQRTLDQEKAGSYMHSQGCVELHLGYLGQRVNRTAYAPTSDFQYMGIDHRSGHVSVPQQLLHGADIVSSLQNCRRK